MVMAVKERMTSIRTKGTKVFCFYFNFFSLERQRLQNLMMMYLNCVEDYQVKETWDFCLDLKGESWSVDGCWKDAS